MCCLCFALSAIVCLFVCALHLISDRKSFNIFGINTLTSDFQIYLGLNQRNAIERDRYLSFGFLLCSINVSPTLAKPSDAPFLFRSDLIFNSTVVLEMLLHFECHFDSVLKH